MIFLLAAWGLFISALFLSPTNLWAEEWHELPHDNWSPPEQLQDLNIPDISDHIFIVL